MSNLKAYKYRLYPNKQQTEKLQWTLDRARELYNAALQERRDAYRMCRVSISYNQQAAQLPEVKEIRPEYNDIHSQVLQDVLRRVKKDPGKLFRGAKQGENPKDPPFQGLAGLDSPPRPPAGFPLPEQAAGCAPKTR